MKIIKRGQNYWCCYPSSASEFKDLVALCKKNLGRSHWSVFVKTWTTRQSTFEELRISSYPRVVEIRNKDIMVTVQLIWG